MNTASRMESNSEPSRINLSHAARRALFDQAPGVQAKSRGEVPIKGKAEPERCFWLVDSDENRSRCAATPPPEEVRRPELDVLKRESQPGSLPVCPRCSQRHPGIQGRTVEEALNLSTFAERCPLSQSSSTNGRGAGEGISVEEFRKRFSLDMRR